VAAIVIGGGVGGLATALALRRVGIDASVYEAAPELPAVGAGLQVWVNGMAALDALGAGDAVAEAGDALEVQEFWSSDGKLLLRERPADMARRHGVRPPMHVRRGDLLRALHEALGERAVETGARCTGVSQGNESARAGFDGGRTESGRLLVGADGVDSVVRPALVGDVRPRYAGYRYIRALTDYGDPSLLGKFVLWTGPQVRFGIHSGPSWIYWFGVLVEPEQPRPSGDRKEELLRAFGDFPPLVRDVIGSTSPEQINQADIRYVPKLDRWADRRIAILGDAAHAVTPNAGRGSGEALEDAVVLAGCLAGVDTSEATAVADALRRYEERRREPVAEIQRFTTMIGRSLSLGNPLAVALRDQFTRHVVGRTLRKQWAAEFDRIRESAVTAERLARPAAPAG
jgi:FAD-dependent urate hydroxylase